MKKILKLSLLSLCLGMVAAGVSHKFATPKQAIETSAEESELSYITKTLMKDDLQVGITTAASHRINLNFCVPSSIDHPANSELRGAYYSNGDGKKLLDLTEAGAGETYDTILARMQKLNFFKGNLLIDGEPVLYQYETDGARNSSGYNKVSFFDTKKGRIVFIKNADSTTDTTKMRLKLQVDVIMPDHDTKIHTVTLKAGTELPSWAYALNGTVGNTTPNQVYKTEKDMTWNVDARSSNIAVTPKAYTNVVPEKVDDAFLLEKSFNVGQVGTNRVKFQFGFFNGYGRGNAASDPNYVYTMRGYEAQTNFYSDPSDYTNIGNLTQLNVWNKVKINDGESFDYFQDGRMRSNGTAPIVEDGFNYSSIFMDLAYGKICPDPSVDTNLKIKFEKGFQMPIISSIFPETTIQKAIEGDSTYCKNHVAGQYLRNDICKYVELDRDYEFVFKHAATESSPFVWTKVSFTAGEAPVPTNTENTKIKKLHLINAGESNNFSYGSFILSNYDYEGTVNYTYNCKLPSWSGEFNASNNAIALDGDYANKSMREIGTAGDRMDRTCIEKNGCGFVFPFKYKEAPFTQIKVKAGTRFPAAAYLTANVKDANATVVPAEKKYYVTTEDVILYKVADDTFMSLEEYASTELSELTSKYDLTKYRTDEANEISDILEALGTSMSSATSIEDVDTLVTTATTSLDAVKTDAQYLAEELATAKTQAKADLDTYRATKSDADYREAQVAELNAAVIAGKEAIDACTVKTEVEPALEAAKSALDAVKTDAQLVQIAKDLAKAFDDKVDAIVATTYTQQLVDQFNAALSAYEALTEEAKTYVTESKMNKFNAIYTALFYINNNQNTGVYSWYQKMAQMMGSQERANELYELFLAKIDIIVGAALTQGKDDSQEAHAIQDAYIAAVNAIKAMPIYLEDYISAIGEIVSPTDTFTVTTQAGQQTLTIDQYIAAVEVMLEGSEAAVLLYVDNEAWLTDAKEALVVAKLIAAIGEVELTAESKAKIDAARAAYNALTDAQKARVNVTPLTTAEATYESLVAADLAAYKQSKVTELQAAYDALDLSKYTEENKSILASALQGGKDAINEAADKTAVDTALSVAKTALMAVEMIPEKTGCGGSITATAGLISLVTLLGAGLVCAKRKED